MRLAAEFDGEIISADSRQVYRRFDIGTAKPTPEQQAVAPHHLLDVVEPDRVLSLADFQAWAYEIIEAVQQRGRLPLLVGGTGQWVWAVVEGWNIPRVAPDRGLRAELEAQARVEGNEALHAQLARVDPQAAQKLDPRNVRRVIRALEVYRKTGVPISQQQHKTPPPYDILQVGLTMSREALYRRVDRRIDQMMEQGLLAEVERLAAAGYGWQTPAMLGLGYRQIGQFLRGEVNLEEAVALIKKETRRFVRQQYNWFRLQDRRLHWFDIEQGLDLVYGEIRELVANWLAKP